MIKERNCRRGLQERTAAESDGPQMKKERIEYLDVLKGIGIFLVVYEHVAMLPKNSVLGNVLMCMSYGAVPCFMMVTGGLMHRRRELDWQKYLLRLVKMYLLLCFWKAVYLLFYKSLYTLSFSPKAIFSYLFLFGTLPEVNSGLLWYLEAYLAVMLLYPVTRFLFRGGRDGRLILLFWSGLVFCGSLAVIVSTHFEGMKIESVAPYMPYGNMFLYFTAGAFLLEERERIQDFLAQKKWGRYAPAALVFAGTLGLMALKFFKTGTWCWEQLHVSNSYYRISTILLAAGIYLAVLQMDSCKNPVSVFIGNFLGKATMGIYVLHGILVPCLQILIAEHFPGNESLGLHLLVTVFTILVCGAAAKVLQKIPVVKEIVL